VILHAQQRAQQVEFSLSNSGPGISPATAHIFERFWQIDNQSRRGLGLGLYGAKRSLAHGGTIAAEWLGTGTTIRFALPLI
jgi:signal transduction histidine kinase